MTPVDTAAYR